MFWEVVNLKRGSLRLVRIIKELLEWKVTAPVQKTEINGRGKPLRWPRNTLYLLELALTSPTSGGCSVDIVRLQTQAMEFVFLFVCLFSYPLTSIIFSFTFCMLSVSENIFFSPDLEPLWALASDFKFHDHFADGRIPWTSDQLVARPLPKHRTTQTQNKHYTVHPCLLWDSKPLSRLQNEQKQYIP
jgi:hypothetical protein